MRWQKINGALFPVRVVQDQLQVLVSLQVTNPWIPGRSNEVKGCVMNFGVWDSLGKGSNSLLITYGPYDMDHKLWTITYDEKKAASSLSLSNLGQSV